VAHATVLKYGTTLKLHTEGRNLFLRDLPAHPADPLDTVIEIHLLE
jgi:hypothetical protein